jgi:hypothetical protein
MSDARQAQALRTFYRIVKTNPPTVADFISNLALGRVPKHPDPRVLSLWNGLSVFDQESQARQKAREAPYLGRYIAELRVLEGDPLRYQRTMRTPGHYTLWGPADVILNRVVGVAPV